MLGAEVPAAGRPPPHVPKPAGPLDRRIIGDDFASRRIAVELHLLQFPRVLARQWCIVTIPLNLARH
jgi:hypothetical protein